METRRREGEPPYAAPDARRASRVPLALLAVYILFWALLAIDPRDRFTWFLENCLVFLFVPLLVLTYGHFRLSNVSYSLLFVYMALHAVGGHYGYSHVPGDWESWGFERNHYDRVVHFAFGLLLAYPVRELFLRVVGARGFWAFYLPFDMMVSFSALYEILEWLAVLVTPGEAGVEFLGSQGDPFDAMKDMALAALGAAITMALTAVVARTRARPTN